MTDWFTNNFGEILFEAAEKLVQELATKIVQRSTSLTSSPSDANEEG